MDVILSQFHQPSILAASLKLSIHPSPSLFQKGIFSKAFTHGKSACIPYLSNLTNLFRILSAVLWDVSMSSQYRRRDVSWLSENEVLREVSVSKSGMVNRFFFIFHPYIYSSYINEYAKGKIYGTHGRGEMRNSYKIFAGKARGKRPNRGTSRTRKGNRP